jgi:hypothetical protein
MKRTSYARPVKGTLTLPGLVNAGRALTKALFLHQLGTQLLVPRILQATRQVILIHTARLAALT